MGQLSVQPKPKLGGWESNLQSGAKEVWSHFILPLRLG